MKRQVGRPKGEEATVVNVRIPVSLVERLDRYLDKLETDTGAYSTPKLPPIPGESCHRFHGKAATCSTRKLPLIP